MCLSGKQRGAYDHVGGGVHGAFLVCADQMSNVDPSVSTCDCSTTFRAGHRRKLIRTHRSEQIRSIQFGVLWYRNAAQQGYRSHGTKEQQKGSFDKGSITLGGAVAMGTGVMIGAGIFALTGQIAQLAGPLFPLAFVAGAAVTGFSAYSYIKMSNTWPSSGGIAMIVQKTYGTGAIAAGAALLMAPVDGDLRKAGGANLRQLCASSLRGSPTDRWCRLSQWR